MRASLPVVASAIRGSGVGEVVSDGETGLLVEPGDPHALAAAIERLCDARMRERLGVAGRQRWPDRFTLGASARATQEIYRAALAQRAAGTIN
jgi:glycosyltransferase involved in cell wall biosynthesis